MTPEQLDEMQWQMRWSNGDLSRLLNTSPTTITNWRSGRIDIPKTAQIAIRALVLLRSQGIDVRRITEGRDVAPATLEKRNEQLTADLDEARSTIVMAFREMEAGEHDGAFHRLHDATREIEEMQK